MGLYNRGDVVLAPVSIDDRSCAKIRPAVVIGTGENGEVLVCPVSSRPPSDAPCVPISLDDFSEGGLDLFDESYVMTSKVWTLRAGDVIGRRGCLTHESMSGITSRLPNAMLPGTRTKNRTGQSRRIH